MFESSCRLLNSCKPKSVIFNTQRLSMMQLDDLRLPCDLMSVACRYCIPFTISCRRDKQKSLSSLMSSFSRMSWLKGFKEFVFRHTRRRTLYTKIVVTLFQIVLLQRALVCVPVPKIHLLTLTNDVLYIKMKLFR